MTDSPTPEELGGDRLGGWAQSMRSKGDGAKVIDLLQAIDDWMVVCHQQESEVEGLQARLAEAERQRDEAVQRVGAALSALSWCAAGYEVREGAVPDHLTRAMESLRAFLGDHGRVPRPCPGGHGDQCCGHPTLCEAALALGGTDDR